MAKRKRDAIDEMHEYLYTLTDYELKQLAFRCGTTVGQLSNIRYRTRKCAAWLAINLDRETRGIIDMEQICPEKIDWTYLRQKFAKQNMQNISRM